MSWPLVKLGVVTPAKTASLQNIQADTNIWQVTLDHIESHSGRLLEKNIKPLSEAGSSTHAFDERHVLYSKLRPYLNKVLLPESVGIGTTELVPMLPDAKRLDRKYLAHYLRSERFLKWVSNQTAGAKMPRVSMKVFWEHEIPLPPLSEQKRIVAILDKAEQLRQKRQQAIALADDFLRSVFLDMFGDPVTNSKGWEQRQLKMIAKVTTGNTPNRSVPDYYGSDIEWIKSDNINTPHHYLTIASEHLSSKGVAVGRTVDAGSTLITCIAGSPSCFGNAALADRKVAFNQQINALTPFNDVTCPEFLYALILFSKKKIQEASTNAMKGMVSKGKLETVVLTLPPIDLQLKA